MSDIAEVVQPEPNGSYSRSEQNKPTYLQQAQDAYRGVVEWWEWMKVEVYKAFGG